MSIRRNSVAVGHWLCRCCVFLPMRVTGSDRLARRDDRVPAVRRGWALLLPGMICVWCAYAQALSPQEIFAQVRDSVVTVLAYNERNDLVALGSGVLLSTGRVITNHHVVSDAPALVVKRGHEVLTARLGRFDARRDLAELSVEGLRGREILLCPLEDVQVGERVYAIGTPEGWELTISEGLVSSTTRDLGSGVQIQTSAPISHGSSGGGLFDESGRLVGITTSSLKKGQNLNFAVPAAAIAELLGQPLATSAEPPPAPAPYANALWLPIITDTEVSGAILEGTRERGKEQGLRLQDIEQLIAAGFVMSDPNNVMKYGANSGFSVLLYTPISWIRQQASASAKLYRPYIDEDVTAQMRTDYVLVAIAPDTPYYATPGSMAQATSVEHVVLRDVDRKIAVQPANQGPYDVDLGNPYGAAVRFTGMVAAFHLQDLFRVRGPKGDAEFFITVIGTNGTERDFKVKRKHFGRLPLPSMYWQMASKEGSTPIPAAVDPLLPPPPPDTMRVAVKCTACGTRYQIQANLGKPVPLAVGSHAFPANDTFVCPKCSAPMDLTAVRSLLERQARKKVM